MLTHQSDVLRIQHSAIVEDRYTSGAGGAMRTDDIDGATTRPSRPYLLEQRPSLHAHDINAVPDGMRGRTVEPRYRPRGTNPLAPDYHLPTAKMAPMADPGPPRPPPEPVDGSTPRPLHSGKPRTPSSLRVDVASDVPRVGPGFLPQDKVSSLDVQDIISQRTYTVDPHHTSRVSTMEVDDIPGARPKLSHASKPRSVHDSMDVQDINKASRHADKYRLERAQSEGPEAHRRRQQRELLSRVEELMSRRHGQLRGAVRGAFRECDADKSGTVDIVEFGAVLRDRLLLPLTDEEVGLLFAALDADDSGKVQYDEFMRALASVGQGEGSLAGLGQGK